MVTFKLVTERPTGLPLRAFREPGGEVDPSVIRVGPLGSAHGGPSFWAIISGGDAAIRRRVVAHLRSLRAPVAVDHPAVEDAPAPVERVAVAAMAAR